MNRWYYLAPVRLAIAYAVSSVVFLSYLWLDKRRKWFGQAYYDQRIERLHTRNAARVHRAVKRLNGLFIKLGQLLSSMGHVLPDAYLDRLQDLQDKAPTTRTSVVRETLEREFGKDLREVFEDFGDNPVASASIAQVHRAKLHNGDTVAVKVKHAHIDRVARLDVAIIRRLISIGMWFFRIDGMEHVKDQIEEMIERELDFTAERASLETIRNDLRGVRGVVTPSVYPDCCSESVLTASWIDGVKVNRVEELKDAGHQPGDIARRLIRLYCVMIFEKGVYHADPHPGNILITPEGNIALLDFGAVGTISEAFRNGIPVLIEAAVENDVDTLITTSQELGFLTDSENTYATAEKMIAALRSFVLGDLRLTNLNFKDVDFDPLNNRMTALVKELGLKNITRSVKIPEEWVLLNRTTSLLAGVIAMLDPELNPLEVVRPYLRRYVIRQRGGFWKIALAYGRERLGSLMPEIGRIEETVQRGLVRAAALVLPVFTVAVDLIEDAVNLLNGRESG